MGAYFTISSIIYIGIFIFFFFSKNKVKTLETKVYKVLLITTFVGLCLDAMSFFAYESGVDPNSFFYQCLAKGVLLYFLTWVGSFTYYIYAISHNHIEDKEFYNYKLKRFKKIIFIVFSALMIFAFLAPINFEVKNNVIFPIGIGVIMTYLTVGVCVALCFYFAFKNIKQIVLKKYTPLFASVVLVIASAIVQMIFPELFLVNFVIALIVVLLYFSIENPDIKIINELSYSKELLKKSNDATNKSLTLLTEELAKPIELFYEFGNKEINLKDNSKMLEDIKKLQNTSLELVDQINGIIELTRLENENSKLDKYDYNTSELFDELHNLLSTNSNVKLNYEVDDNISNVLNGDSFKIKQTIINIYNYLIEKHNIEKINLKISSTNTKTMSRLRFSFVIKGIENNKLFINNSIEDEIISRLIELQNAKIDVKNIEKNTIIEFLVNQSRVLKYDVSLEEEVPKKIKYFDCSQRNVLLIDDNYEKINYLINLLKPYNLKVDIAHNYLDYEKKMYSGIDWDLILLDDMMPDSYKFDFFKLNESQKNDSLNNIKNLTNDDLPIVIMVTPNNEMNKISGDYLVKPIHKTQLHDIIVKYMK